jgi:glutamate synthase (NADPH/NADH) large chain
MKIAHLGIAKGRFMNFSSEENQGLYVPELEHDACGIGFVAHLKNRKSHQVIEDALAMLARMEHRGGTGCDPCSGDGAGILIQKPHAFFIDECLKLDFSLPATDKYGVGVMLFPQDDQQRQECRDIFERNAKKIGLEIIGYRSIPTDNSMIGEAPLSTEPVFEHVFVQGGADVITQQDLERKLYVLRNYTIKVINQSVSGIKESFYINSFSSRTVVYKGQLTTEQVPQYFLDLQNKDVVTALALVHSRFSTNTFPKWRLAQPFRFVAHNGEINTVRGNRNWMRAREALFESNLFPKEEIEMLKPICDESASDSANFDMAIELLTLSGRSLPHALMMMVPEAWQENPEMEADRRGFYEFHASLMEPWDGPASLCFTDGVSVGATLDRNGLRPSRFTLTKDDFVVMASETGVVEIDPANVKFRGRLKPGRIFVANLEEGRIIDDVELKAQIATQKPYKNWVAEFKINLSDLPPGNSHCEQPTSHALYQQQQTFGYSKEDIYKTLQPMASDGKEPTGSMGADWPLAVLSHQAQHLSNYFKQLFAQVTNPPIDPIRERMVMSLKTYVGRSGNLLNEKAQDCHKVELDSPVLSNNDLEKLRSIDHSHFQTKTLDINFRASGKKGALKRALERICQYTVDAVEDGFSIIILSDRCVDSDHAPIPAMLAVGAVHHHLIRKGLRANCGLIVETGEVRETHHFATLVGYGASAVNPYLAIETMFHQRNEGFVDGDLSDQNIFENYKKSIDAGLLKIFSKMGISTLQSYHGAQIFEALGLSKEVIDQYFTGTVSRIGGLKLEDIAREALVKHQLGFPIDPVPNARLDVGGVYQWKQRGERHLFNPATIHLLQNSTKSNNPKQFKEYCKIIDEQGDNGVTLRSLFDFTKKNPISIEDVEPVENIFKRFATGAMSFGSISWEAHTTLALAMNRIGGKSNSGEGGEDPIRFKEIKKDAMLSELFPGKVLADQPLKAGDSLRSAIKQVASGRFGVTSNYLTNANELQIKMAQGAKPGEGGQLPGPKVDDWIGETRHSTPGVGLISPPPHHDIYSIEDLAQLIYDLKNSNRDARVNVKLVSEAGVGTIATGACKAKADVVLIAGYDGGTGASPQSSIRHAGLPWELGLAETHQTLVKNKLRSRIVVQADGQMKTPRDLAIATLLGAEEWGVATAALVVEGCIMMRKCHLNTCPVGVATQNKTLRSRFSGKVDDVVNFFNFLGEGLREIMADLGFKTIDEMVGQAQHLKVRDNIKHWKYTNLNLDTLLFKQSEGEEDGLCQVETQNHGIDKVIDWKMLEVAKPAIENGDKVSAAFTANNLDRSIGAILSNEISKVHGAKGLPEDSVIFSFKGSVGQSFGAFLAKGVTMNVEGDANDYFGKGLSGGKISVAKDRTSDIIPKDNIIAGNVCFYGATSGDAYISGVAGERFCVRNSGAQVVVEGIGDHGCEYMTGGIAIILGATGRNFAAGMSGGVAYVMDAKGDFVDKKANHELVDFDPLSQEDKALLRQKIETHVEVTHSDVGKHFLANWDESLRKMVKVMPRDYKRVLAERAQEKEFANG